MALVAVFILATMTWTMAAAEIHKLVRCTTQSQSELNGVPWTKDGDEGLIKELSSTLFIKVCFAHDKQVTAEVTAWVDDQVAVCSPAMTDDHVAALAQLGLKVYRVKQGEEIETDGGRMKCQGTKSRTGVVGGTFKHQR